MGISEGVETHQILRDLTFIKLPEDVRYRVKALNNEFRTRNLTHREEIWIRRHYDRRAKQVRELHDAEQRVRETDAKMKRGSARDRMLRLQAKRLTETRAMEKKAALELEIEEIEEAQQDFGI